MTDLLITGATGLLGSALLPEAMRRSLRVTGLYAQPRTNVLRPALEQIDLTHLDDVVNRLSRIRPRIIIHSAAATDVDRCELDTAWCTRLNVEATRTLAEWCAQNRARLIYISTDSVFDGSRGHYSESDPAKPLNTYAKSKYAGEQEIRRLLDNHVIVRTNFYGWGTGDRLSLGEWILRSYLRQEPIKSFIDVRFSPLYTPDLARVIFDLALGPMRGTYHAGSHESCSKHEFALLVAKAFGVVSEVTPVSVDSFQFRAPRPKDTSLNVEKLSKELGRSLPTLREGMERFKEQYDSGHATRDTSQWHVSSI